jgi:D-aminopeptidase
MGPLTQWGAVMRARDLGIVIGEGTPGPLNAITDIAGVRVGHATLIRGEGARVVGEGPVRTGVTIIVPHDGDIWTEPIFAGCHTLNGNGELTGLEWIREAGLLASAIALTNTHSVGIVHDALIAHAARGHAPGADYWSLPVVGETWDGILNDIAGFHVRPEHVDQALAAAEGGPVVEGTVGGGTGMVCSEFKGGIGTASRVITGATATHGGWTVGALVQANYGRRSLLRIDGVPVGRAIPVTEVPSPRGARRPAATPPGDGSIIVIVATDAPLLPHQCARLAQRAGLGVARMGSIASTTSGDLFLCFATGNRGLPPAEGEPGRPALDVRMVAETSMDPLFEATVEATEEAIVNALVAATTTTGCDGITAHALPHDRLVEVMARYGRPAGGGVGPGSG